MHPSPIAAPRESRISPAAPARATAQCHVTGSGGATISKRPRPDVLSGGTRELDTQFGAVFVTVNEDAEGHPFEVFVRLDKAGSRAMADAEAIARLISLALRWGVPTDEVHRQLRGISCEDACTTSGLRVLSLPDAIAQALEGLVPGLATTTHPRREA